MNAQVIDLIPHIAAYRTATRPALSKTLTLHSALESIFFSNLRIADASIRSLFAVNFAIQRNCIRTMTGH